MNTAGSQPPSKRRAGFTLIELLVVITIIALLAALLFPVFARAREKGRQVTCLSNMRQITTGLLMYADDADNRCVLFYSGFKSVSPGSRSPGWTGPSGFSPDKFWPELVAPYIQTQASHDLNSASKVFVCPSAPYDAAAITLHKISNTPSYGLSDHWAEYYCPDDCNNGTGAGHSFSEAGAPAGTVLLAETLSNTDVQFPGFSLALSPIDGGNTAYFYRACDSAGRASFSPARMFNVLSWRHTQRKLAWCDVPPSDAHVNVAYADGHVKAVTLAQLSDFKQWAILQGNGDVGCHPNIDGQTGCWYP